MMTSAIQIVWISFLLFRETLCGIAHTSCTEMDIYNCPAKAQCSQGKCECWSGYEMARLTEYGANYCKAVCKPSCGEYATCVGPDECACAAGYKLITEICEESVCTDSCMAGICKEQECRCHIAIPETCIAIPSTSTTETGDNLASSSESTVSSSESTAGSSESTAGSSESTVEGSGNNRVRASESERERQKDCPGDAVYYQGDCRLVFPDVEEKCKNVQCRHNEKCDQGKCSCLPGFVLTGAESNTYCTDEMDTALLNNSTILAEGNQEVYDVISNIGVSVMALAAVVLLIAIYKKFMH